MMSGTWHVLGAGSLGGLWATRLFRAGVPTRIILRNPERLASYRAAGGLTLIEADRSDLYPVQAELPDSQGPVERLLVACKAYDAEAAVAEIAPRLTRDAEILLLQNGLGSQQAIAARWPESRCIFISSTEGAYRQPGFRIVHAGKGQNWLGDAHPRPRPSWLDELDAAAIPNAWTDQIMVKLWRKLAINCAINPLTVLHDCCNGALLAHRAQLHRLCNELTELLRRCSPDNGELEADVLRIVEATANNYSSMLQDVRNRRRTEISFMSGHACRAAQVQGLAVPELDALHTAVQHLLRQHGLPVD